MQSYKIFNFAYFHEEEHIRQYLHFLVYWVKCPLIFQYICYYLESENTVFRTEDRYFNGEYFMEARIIFFRRSEGKYSKPWERQAKRMISYVFDDNDILQISSMSIMKVSSYFRTKFQPIEVFLRRLANCGVKCVTPETCAAIQELIPLEELHIAIKKRKITQIPRTGWNLFRIFKTAWDVIKHDLLKIINLMYIEGKMTAP